FVVRHGRQELGSVDQTTFLSHRQGPRVLLLGGRAWRVTHLDWSRRIAHVEATEETGRSRWRGSGPTLGFRLCQALRRLLDGEGAEGVAAVEEAVLRLARMDGSAMEAQVEEAALEGLKFARCLPNELALATLVSRLRDGPAIRAVLGQPMRVVSGV